MSDGASQGYKLVPQAITVCRELVRSNLGMGFVLVGLARAALQAGKREAVERAGASARGIHDNLLRFLGRIENDVQRNQLEVEVAPLGEKLDSLDGELKSNLECAQGPVVGTPAQGA